MNGSGGRTCPTHGTALVAVASDPYPFRFRCPVGGCKTMWVAWPAPARSGEGS